MILFNNAKIQNIRELYLIKQDIIKFYHIYFIKHDSPHPTRPAPRGRYKTVWIS